MHPHSTETGVSNRPYYRGPNPEQLLDGLIDADTLARAMGIHRNTLHAYASDPTFPKSAKLGRFIYFNFASVRRWLNERLGINDDE